MRLCLGTILLTLLLAASCAALPFDLQTEQQKLLQRDAEWATAAAAGADVEKIVSYWSDDALVVPPGHLVIEGKAALREFVAASLKIPGFKIHWASEKPVFSPDGKMAFMRGENEMTVPGPDGALTTIRGRSVTVWRRDGAAGADGEWRCVVDIWNAPPSLEEVAGRE